jgi:hypothetical protein
VGVPETQSNSSQKLLPSYSSVLILVQEYECILDCPVATLEILGNLLQNLLRAQASEVGSSNAHGGKLRTIADADFIHN